MHDRQLRQRDDALGCRWPVAEGTVRSPDLVMVAPAFDDDLGFSQRVEGLAVKQFIAEAGIEALAITVLSR